MSTIYCTFLFLLISAACWAQDFTLTTSQVETSRTQAEDLIDNYETSLNNLGDTLTTTQEKEYFLTDILQNIFEGEDVLVYNDLDPGELESMELTAKTYLNNVITKFYKGVQFNFSDIQISDPYYLGERSFFIKVELASNISGVHIDQPIDNFQALDIYLQYDIDKVFNISYPTIYSVTAHSKNLDQFTPVVVDKGAGFVDFSFIDPGYRLKYRRGKAYEIQWKSNEPNVPVRLELLKSNQLLFEINPVVTGNKYRWDIPSDMQVGSDYQIRIINLKNRENSAKSQAFAIRRKIPLGLKIAALTGVAGIVYYVLTLESDDEVIEDNFLPEPPEVPGGSN